MKSNILLYIIIILLSLLFLRECSHNKSLTGTVNKNIHLTDSLITLIDLYEYKIKTEIDKLKIENKIENLKSQKRTLYDWNSVVRTKERPDDIMIKYDVEINNLQLQLNEQ